MELAMTKSPRHIDNPLATMALYTGTPMLTAPDDTPFIQIDVGKLVRSKMLITANSGGGKSYAIRRILEQTFGHAQHIVFDWDGEFHTLREKFEYALIGDGGDAPAVLEDAPLLARRLLELGVSAIIDLSSLGAKRALYVKAFVESMMTAPRDLWHDVLVIVDECHKLAPEKGAGEAVSTEAIKDLATDGRKRGFCLVAATQRVAELHKSVVAECQNRLVGLTTMDLDIDRARRIVGMKPAHADEVLKGLEPGQFFVHGPALSKVVTLAQIGPVVTTHPEAGGGTLRPTPPRGKVLELLSAFKDLHREAVAEAATVDALKTRVRELESTTKPTDAPEVQRAFAETERLRIELAEHYRAAAETAAVMERAGRLHATLKEKCQLAWALVNDILALLTEFGANSANSSTGGHVVAGIDYTKSVITTEHQTRGVAPAATTPAKPAKRPKVTKRDDGAYTVGPPPDGRSVNTHLDELAGSNNKRRDLRTTILTVLAQRGGTLPKRKVLIYGRYARSGATDKMFAELTAAGLIVPVPEGIRITDAGRAEVGVTSPLDPVVRDMPDLERALLAVLHCYGELSKKEALLYAGYARSGATDSAFANLVANDWATSERDGGLHITKDGIEALGPHDPPSIGPALRDRIRASLGSPAAKFFDQLCRYHFEVADLYVTKKQVLKDTGYARSGATDAAFALLVRRDYAIADKSGQIAINPGLFRHG